MHTASKLGSFMALRANGWSLAKISKELNVSKSTLWEWDNQNKNEIHLLKHLQLEKLQEKYLPTYEEELSKLRSYLDRLESALETQDFSKMGPEYVLQMALQLRARLGKMREQVPLRPVPINQPLAPLPFTGCVSRQDAQNFREEYFEGESVDDPAADEVGRSIPAEPCPSPVGRDSVEPSSGRASVPASQEPAYGVPPSGGPVSSETSPPSVANPGISVDPCSSVVDSSDQNRTFPDETPPGVKNRPLIHNDFRHRRPNGRPVLHSQNGNGHVNGNGNGHHNPEDRRHP